MADEQRVRRTGAADNCDDGVAETLARLDLEAPVGSPTTWDIRISCTVRAAFAYWLFTLTYCKAVLADDNGNTLTRSRRVTLLPFHLQQFGNVSV